MSNKLSPEQKKRRDALRKVCRSQGGIIARRRGAILSAQRDIEEAQRIMRAAALELNDMGLTNGVSW